MMNHTATSWPILSAAITTTMRVSSRYCIFAFFVNRERATYAAAVHSVDGLKLLKYGYCIVRLADRRRQRAAEMLKDEDGVDLSAEPLVVRYGFLVDRKPISPAETIKVSSIENNSAVIVGREVMLTHLMQRLQSYTPASKEDDGGCFVDVLIMASWRT